MALTFRKPLHHGISVLSHSMATRSFYLLAREKRRWVSSPASEDAHRLFSLQPPSPNSLLDFPIPNATRTNFHLRLFSIDDNVYFLDVGIELPFGEVMSMADAVSELRPFSTYLTSVCH